MGHNDPGYWRENLFYRLAMKIVNTAEHVARLYRGAKRRAESKPPATMTGHVPPFVTRCVRVRRRFTVEHAEMLQAIAVKDAERARRAGETHVLNGKRRWRDVVSLGASEEAPGAGGRRKIRGAKPGKTA